MSGFYLVFEGPDGSGKTTQAKRLAAACQAIGSDVLETREPGGTPAGDKIRAILVDPKLPLEPETEMYLFAANRAETVRKVVLPALKEGKLVISDRHVDSSIAYQGAGRELGMKTVREINQIAIDGVVPHLTILLDVPVATSVARSRFVVKDRGVAEGEGDRFEQEKLEFHERLHRAFLRLVEIDPKRYLKIDASLSLGDVTIEIFSRLARRFPARFGALRSHVPSVPVTS